MGYLDLLRLHLSYLTIKRQMHDIVTAYRGDGKGRRNEDDNCI